MIINIIISLIGFLITYIILPYFHSMLTEGNCLESNYLEQKIPIGIGIVFVIVQTFICTFLAFLYRSLQPLILIYCIMIAMISLVSLLDDLAGEKKIKGLKGHLASLVKGRLTSGGLKAIIGFISSALISLKLFEGWSSLLVNILLISLFSNTINMFDLRPGRGLKVFIFLSLFMTIIAFRRDFDFIILLALGIVLAYLPNDIKGLSMMGDVGANFLGATLGFYSVVSQHHTIKLALLFVLILIHIIGEILSFTRIIEENRLLKYLDNLGRQ